MEQPVSPNFDIRVFTTNPAAPENGHVYVWSGTRWYDRIEETGGAVGFTLIADNEDDLRTRLLERGTNMTEIDDDYATQVREEFGEILPMDLYPKDRSDAPPFDEQDTDEGTV